MCLSLFDKKLSPKTNNIVIKFGMQKKNTQEQSLMRVKPDLRYETG